MLHERLHERESTNDGESPAHPYCRLLPTAARLSDAELLSRVVLLARAEREATVELVAHLAELDARRLYRGEGYSSLFGYCTGTLRLAEHAAYNRIEAARASREFPAILDLLADGWLTLSAVRLLAPHLRRDNFESVVAMAKGKSKREVEMLVACLAPRPDVPSSVRKVPVPSQHADTVVSSTSSVPVSEPAVASQPTSLTTALTASPKQADGHADASSVVPGSLQTLPSLRSAVTSLARPADRLVIDPLAPARYRVQFTVGEATHEKLRRAQDLLRREIPSGDFGAIFDRALTLLLEDIARKRVAETSKPKPRPVAVALTRSRHIPAHVKRAVWLRDGGQCAFVAPNGRRCTARAFLEFHHQEPYAIGGETTVANVSLRCQPHNTYEAELAFGSSVLSAAREARADRANSPRGESDTSCGGRPSTAPQDRVAGSHRSSIGSASVVEASNWVDTVRPRPAPMQSADPGDRMTAQRGAQAR